MTNLIHSIDPLDPLEQTHINNALTWVASGAPLCRIHRPATPPQHLVSYFTLVDTEAKQMLLVHHKKSGLWLPSGGHVEVGEHPSDTVRREVQEELSIEADFLLPDPLLLTMTETVPEMRAGVSTTHTDVSLWYVLRGTHTQPLDYDTREFHTVQWFPVDALPEPSMTDPHMGRFVEKLQRKMLWS